MSVENQKPINKNTLRVLGAFGRLDNILTRLTFPICRRVLALRGIEMHLVGSYGEEQALVRRIEPIIKDATEIHAIEGDLSEGLFTDRKWTPDSRIKITQVPAGAAPEEIRRSWLGLELDAYKLPRSDQNIELDLVTRQPITPRPVDLYVVKSDEALRALGQNSPSSAKWFRNHLHPEINALSFGANEVKVIRKNQGKLS